MTINLLTGKTYDRTFLESERDSTVEQPWTSDAYLASMRRLLTKASASSSTAEAAVMVGAAHVLAVAADVTRNTADVRALIADALKTAPAARNVPGDGDTIR